MLNPIKNFEGLYFFSDKGEIFNAKGKQLRGFINNIGYQCIDLWKDRKRTKHLYHRLIAESAVPNPLNKPEVNHIDANKLNNAISNLEWVTSAENKAHAKKLGLINFVASGLGRKVGITSQYHCVGYDKSKNKWYCSIQDKKVIIAFKRFNSEIEAAHYYNEMLLFHGLTNRPFNVFD